MACENGILLICRSTLCRWLSLVAALVGPRIGKYNTDGTVNAIPGHNLMLGALGVYFMVWMVYLIQGHN
jgi:hypothetical protein